MEELSLEHKANRYSKKLQAEVIFKLLLHCLLTQKGSSLRGMASAYESVLFGLLNGSAGQGKLSHSSISERLSSLDPACFSRLFESCVLAYKATVETSSPDMVSFDSTIVALSGKLLGVGYNLAGSASGRRQVKFCIGYTDIPEQVRIYKDQRYTSENLALKESILDFGDRGGMSVRVFDRGVTSRATYDLLSSKGTQFVSRMGKQSKHLCSRPNQVKRPIKTSTLYIHSDEWVYLFGTSGKQTTHTYRLISGTRLDNGEPIRFITNIEDMGATEISELYLKRWDIEVFFKFLKQYLDFGHLTSRSENGIKTTIYITLIAAILIIAYKKIRGLKGLKLARQAFAQELEKELMREIVTMTGGSLQKFDKIFNINSS